MAYNALNNLIDAYIYANGVQAITGQILNGVLKQMVAQLGSGYHLMGVAGPGTVPEQNDYAMAYFAATAGEYTDFGGITLADGEVAVLLTYGNGSWTKQTLYIVPVGTSDLVNDAEFITNTVADLANYYTKTEIDTTLEDYPTLAALATALADFYTKAEYWKFCRGKMPRLLSVPGFDGILIHPGTDALDTKGCVLVGRNTKVGKLTESRACFQELYKVMKEAADRGETITIEIK